MNEYPKESGWYWYRELPSSKWKPIRIDRFFNGKDQFGFESDRGAGGWLNVTECWPQQWGGKIEEPKA